MSASLEQPNSVIHRTDSNKVNFDKFFYRQVYASADATININGQSVTIAKGTILPISVKRNQIGSNSSVYLLGVNKQTGAGNNI